MRFVGLMIGLVAVAAFFAGCASTPNPGDAADRSLLHTQTQMAIADFEARDPSIKHFFQTAHAYAVFPEVVTGAAILGGAHGDGEVYQSGKMIGYADVSQGSIGAQLGGQRYAEVVFFQNEGTFVDFKYGATEIDARATAIAAASGAAATADYRHGVLVFTLPQSGLMAQAAVGVQKFRFLASAQ